MKPLAIALFAAALLAGGTALACPTHAVQLPEKGAAGPSELLDTPFVKLLRVTVGAGQKLAGHKVPQAITIQALSGRGTVKTGDVVDPLSPTDVVLVGPGAEHEITAEAGQDLVLLVHVLPMPGGDALAGHDHHHGHDHAHGPGHDHGAHGGEKAKK